MILLTLRLLVLPWAAGACYTAYVAVWREKQKVAWMQSLLYSLIVGAFAISYLVMKTVAAGSWESVIPNAINGVGVVLACAVVFASHVAYLAIRARPSTPSAPSFVRRGIAVWVVAVSLLVANTLGSNLASIAIAPRGSMSTPGLFAYLSLQIAYIMAEETFYRGWVLTFLLTKVSDSRPGRALAYAGSAILFAAQHVDSYAPNFVFLSAFFGGVLFGVLCRRYGLMASIVAHFVTNLSLAFVLPVLGN